jgi:hypothetical protein
MHRIDADAHVGNLFDEGDPAVPRLPTQVDKHWLNMVQEELVALATDAGITLVKGTNTQLRDSIRGLFVRVTGTASQTVTGVKTFTSKLIASYVAGGGGGGGLRGLFESNAGEGSSSDYTVAVRNYHTGGGLDASGGTHGVKGTATLTSATAAGVRGDGVSAAAYGVIAEGGTASNPARAAMRIVPQTGVPANAQMGDLYVGISDGKLRIYNGSAWAVVGTQT